MKPEEEIENYLKKVAKENNFLCYKFKSPGNNGVPDRLLIGHDMIFFVETKAPGEKPRKLQLRVFNRIRQHGANVFVLDTKEKIDELFNKLNQLPL